MPNQRVIDFLAKQAQIAQGKLPAGRTNAETFTIREKHFIKTIDRAGRVIKQERISTYAGQEFECKTKRKKKGKVSKPTKECE